MKEKESLTVSQFLMNIMNGLGTGTVIVVLPAGLFGQIFLALREYHPILNTFYSATQFVSSLMGMVSGVIIGLLFKFSALEAISVGLAVFFAGGALKWQENVMVLSGMGDIIVMAITAGLAVWIVKTISHRLKAYQLLLLPSLVLFIAGGIGALILPYLSQVTAWIGWGIQYLLTLQPLLMSMFIAASFALIIISPLTSAGIALTIGITGLGAGIAAVGISAAGLGLAWAGRKLNPVGTAIAHIIGSPKLSLSIFLRKPLMFLPMLLSAAVSGIAALYLNIIGNPMSAGFGLSGMLGPVTHLSQSEAGWTLENLLITLIAFFVIPLLTNVIFYYLCANVWNLVSEEDYHIQKV